MSVLPNPLQSPLERLVDLGYAVQFARGAFVECLVEGQECTYRGVGSTAERALEDALRHALPTPLARALWAALAPTVDAPVEVEPVDAPAAEAESSLVEPVAEEPVAEEPVAAEPVAAEPVAAVPAVVEPSEVATADAVEQPRGPSLAELREAVEETVDAIGRARDELGGLPPRALHVQMAVWLGRMRGMQDAVGAERGYELVNAEVLHRLQRISRQLWPGNLNAMRADGTPADLQELLGARLDSWAATAQRAEALLDADEVEAWLDPPDRHAPARPDGLVREQGNVLDRILGADAWPDHARGDATLEALRPDPEREAALTQVARRLRWARPFVQDGWRWGLLMGRLRWARQRLRLAEGGALAHALSPATAPFRGWAIELGLDPESQLRRKLRYDLLRELRDGELDVAGLRTWFARATDAFNAPELVPLLRPYASLLGTIDAAQAYVGGENRSVRKRHRSVLERLAAPVDAAAEQAALEALQQSGDDDGDQATEDAVVEADAIEDEAVAAARALVEGKRTLVVGNREDPELRAALVDQLGLREVKFYDCNKHKRLGQACERIAGGRVDLVLLVTGFIGHSAEAVVRRAVRDRNVPIVRSDRGRVGQTVRAILRDVGGEVVAAG